MIIDDNCDILHEKENSGDVFVKYMTIFDGLLIKHHFPQSPKETCYIQQKP